MGHRRTVWPTAGKATWRLTSNHTRLSEGVGVKNQKGEKLTFAAVVALDLGVVAFLSAVSSVMTNFVTVAAGDRRHVHGFLAVPGHMALRSVVLFSIPCSFVLDVDGGGGP